MIGSDPRRLISALGPTVECLVTRHMESSKEWFPHELVPWGRGADFPDGWQWSPDDSPLPAAVRDALFVNLLTEDNLPHYFETINRVFGSDDAWGAWSKRWTAEEGRHAIVIRDYMTVTRAVDPVELERARMAQVTRAEVPQPPTPHDALAYVSMQELATRIAHLNTGRLLDDDAGYQIMKRVAGDENRHHLFYRDLVAAAFELDPDEMMVAVHRQVKGFAMPGSGIDGFAKMARNIAQAGIYDVRIHVTQIIEPLLFTQWRIQDLELGPTGEKARDDLVAYVERLRKVIRRSEARDDSRVGATS